MMRTVAGVVAATVAVRARPSKRTDLADEGTGLIDGADDDVTHPHFEVTVDEHRYDHGTRLVLVEQHLARIEATLGHLGGEREDLGRGAHPGRLVRERMRDAE